MEVIIRLMSRDDKLIVMDMMRRFYNSPALITNGSEEIFSNNIETCINDPNYVEGYVFIVEGQIVGYGILAKSYSTEFGNKCIWIEDIFIEESHRGNGIGTKFIKYTREKYPKHLLRLEAEKDNHRALASYKKNGFSELPYMELILKPQL